MKTIEIPFYVYSTDKLGIFLDKMDDGDNMIQCTYKKANGAYLFPKQIGVVLDKRDAIETYGVTKIQKGKDRLGIYIPMNLFREANK